MGMLKSFQSTVSRGDLILYGEFIFGAATGKFAGIDDQGPGIVQTGPHLFGGYPGPILQGLIGSGCC